jgi:hypothetical protein
MDISRSIHAAHIVQSSGLLPSVSRTESMRAPVNKQLDSFTFSDKARAALNVPEPFEDKSSTQTKQYEADIIKPLSGEKSLAGKQQNPLADKILPEENSSESKKFLADGELSAKEKPLSSEELSDDELLEVEELKRRDTEVRAHEQAHLSAAGSLAQGGANFSFETGPDGNRYAVGGDVNIDTSAVAGDPQATLRKAQQIRRAASAPVDPSSQDRSVAAQASRMEAQARVEISQQAREKQTEYIDENTPEVDFFGQKNDQNEQNIQDTYIKIQNSSALQEQRNFVDFFI